MNKKEKIISIFLSFFFILILSIYLIIIRYNIIEKKFVQKNIEVYEKNIEQIFKIDKIILCSSANAVDLSEDKKMSNLNIYQYTDIAIYINNGETINNRTTAKELYINNIELEYESDNGQKSLIYKNINKFGLKEDIYDKKETKDIYFNIINTNEENLNANYDDYVFYTDFSNPITLEYLNYDIITGYKINENSSFIFDGNVLQATGISAENLKCKVKFRINIVNNEGEKYYCPISIDIPLEDIFKGTTMKEKITNGQKYIFFREV